MMYVVQTVSTMVYLQEVEMLGKRLGEINVHLHWCVYVCVRWGGGEVGRWRGGEVEKWGGGEVERWKGGEVERWRGGEVGRWGGAC